jgi:hypothetical protein
MNTTHISCWQARHDEQTDQSVWQSISPPPWLKWFGSELALMLPAGCSGLVNGLPAVGALQVVGPGDLVRVTAKDDSQTAFVVGQVHAESEPGNGRTCRFCGLPIQGDAIRCSCGRLFCATILKTYDRCPGCNQQFEADTRPSERLL